MQVVLDYRGFRITAMPLLPLKELVYGSSDAGATLKHSHELTNASMKACGESLHLAGHMIRGFDVMSYSAVSELMVGDWKWV